MNRMSEFESSELCLSSFDWRQFTSYTYMARQIGIVEEEEKQIKILIVVSCWWANGLSEKKLFIFLPFSRFFLSFSNSLCKVFREIFIELFLSVCWCVGMLSGWERMNIVFSNFHFPSAMTVVSRVVGKVAFVRDLIKQLISFTL